MSKAKRKVDPTTGKRERLVLSGRQKAEAVLALWSERRKPAELCQEMEIPYSSLSNWEARAMKAMLEALEPRKREEEDRGPALSAHMEKVLAKAHKRNLQATKLEKRLERIQQGQEKSSSPAPA